LPPRTADIRHRCPWTRVVGWSQHRADRGRWADTTADASLGNRSPGRRACRLSGRRGVDRGPKTPPRPPKTTAPKSPCKHADLFLGVADRRGSLPFSSRISARWVFLEEMQAAHSLSLPEVRLLPRWRPRRRRADRQLSATNGPRAVACDSLGHNDFKMPCAIVERNNAVGEDQEDRHRDGRSPDSTYGIAVYAEPALCNLDLVAGTTGCAGPAPMAKETRDQRGLPRQQYRRRDAPRCAVQRRHPTPSLRRRSHRVLAIALAHSMGRGGRIGTQFGHRRLAPRSALLTGVSPRSWITLERRLAVEVGGSAIERYRES
jgi:hypothetical protein